MESSDTLGILRQLERGEIDVNEADARLHAPPEIERDDGPRADGTDAPDWIQRLWVYPFAAGLLLVGLGAWIIVATVDANILWLLLGLPFVLLGSLIMAAATSAWSGHWIYVNIKQAGRHRQNIRFGLPVPFGLIRFGLWIAQWFDPHPRAHLRVNGHASDFNIDWSDADAFITELERELAERRGVTVDVDDDDERVQVYIV